MNYYIGADLGTSSLKIMLVSNEGDIVKSTTRDYAVCYPAPGHSEQFAGDWWDAFVSAVRELAVCVPRESIRGIGIGGQMHGLVILDECDEPIRPVILWNDGRTSKETEYLNTVVGVNKLASLTGNMAFAGFTAPKILWLYNNERESFDRIKKIMLPKDYLNYRLTGVHASDYSDAAGTLMLDVKNKCWSAEMLDICKVSLDMMPKLFESGEVIGKLTENVAIELGLTTDVIVVAGAGDNAAAAIGTGTFGEGKCNISLGTSGTVLVSSDRYFDLKNNAIHSFCHADGGYHILGCILSAASCNKWFYEDILGTDDYVREQGSVESARLGENHVYFLPYLMGERSPINDTDARGTFIGMRADTTRRDMVEAVMEGVAFAVKDNIELAIDAGVDIKKSKICGGGGKSPIWRKIVANVLGIEIEVPTREEGPSFGGAMLAMTACGEYANIYECADKLCGVRETVSPDPELTRKYAEKYENYKKIYPALKQVFKEIK